MSDDIQQIPTAEEAAAWMAIIRSLAAKWQTSEPVRATFLDWAVLRDAMAAFADDLSRAGEAAAVTLAQPTLALASDDPGAMFDPVFMFDPADNAAFLATLAADLAALESAMPTA